MKSNRVLTACALSLLLCIASARADVTITLSVGKLFTSNGADFPSGGLIQLVADTSQNGFTSPTAASFTGGSADDFLLASFGSNNFPGPGSAQTNVTFTLGQNGVTVADPLLLRWWPTLTTGATQPGGGTSFGEFRTNAIENGSTIAWAVPASDGNYDLNFITATYNGTEPDLAGRALFTVPAAIPEPSTLALALCGALGALPLIRRKLARA